MVIKKKPIKKQNTKTTKTVISKKTIKKSTPKKVITGKKAKAIITKDSNRGRPKKEFKLKHKRISQDNLSPIIHEIPRSHKIKDSSNRDRSILYLFIFSVVLFIFSIGISIMKKDRLEQFKEPLLQEKEKEEIEIIIEEKPEETNVSQYILDFYESINTKNIDSMNKIVDTTLRNWNTFRTYFNTKRISRFIDNLTETKITVSNLEEIPNENENIKNYTFTIEYTLTTDNETYLENRSMTVSKRWEEHKISKIMCDTTGCSRMPFFNPWKYNIK